jgi:UDP-glucose 4-epimerase
MNYFKNKTLLITGGTGSFGGALLEKFSIENTPIKEGVFFMDDDFFVDVHKKAEPPRHPHQYVEPEKVELPKSEAEKLLEQ